MFCIVDSDSERTLILQWQATQTCDINPNPKVQTSNHEPWSYW